jgi:hypothetical protein
MIVFTCQDCGHRIISYVFPDAERLCASCFWIRQYIPADQQMVVRERLGVRLVGEKATDRSSDGRCQ